MSVPESTVHAPERSIWPVVLSLGLTLLLFGLTSSIVFSAVGAVLLAWSLIGWIGELRHAAPGHD